MHDTDYFAHPHFALWLHTDTWLSQHIGSTMTRRHTQHEWPLSCVQHLHTADGRSFFYKVQRPPSVECAVYRHRTMVSCLLQHVDIVAGHPTSSLPALLFHDEGARPATRDDFNEQRMHELWRTLAQLPETLPVWVDISNWVAWQAYMKETLAMLSDHIHSGRFHRVYRADTTRLHAIAIGDEMREFHATTTMGVVHGDVHLGNLLIRNDALVIIDWQRPLRAAQVFDVIHFTAMCGGDMRIFPAVALWYWALLRIDWLVRAGHTWFPAGCPTYDHHIRHIIDQMYDLAPVI